MTRSPAEEFWSLICDFRDVVVVIWSASILFFLISAALLVTNATNQGGILKLNLLIFTIPVVVSLVILTKCKGR